MALKRVVAIDCGAAHVAAGWFTDGTGGEIRLEAFAREDFTWDPTDESGWFSHVREALASLLMRRPCRGAKCCLSIPGHLVLTKVVKTPAVTRAHQARVIEFEASQNIPSPLEEVRWGCLKVADDGTDLELLLSAVRRAAVESLCELVEAAGLAVVGCEPAGVALWRTTQRVSPGPAMVVDVGAQSTQLVFTGGNAVYLRTLAIGGNTVTSITAQACQIGFAAAETIKRQVLRGEGSNEAAREGVT